MPWITGKRRANRMMSHDSPNDLIETVTAEIEAIIQEEINLQNFPVPADSEENVAAEVSEVEQAVNEGKVEVETEKFIASVEIAENKIEETETSENLVEEHQPEIPVEKQLEMVEFTSATETVVNEVNEVKADIVAEYTVQIGYPSQEEKITVLDVNENLTAVPLIETILKDAPIDENDGPRAKHFKQALRKALNNTVKSCRYFYLIDIFVLI